MADADHVVDRLLEQDIDPKDFLGQLVRKRTVNLGWLLRNWQKVEGLRFEYRPENHTDGELVAVLKQGEWGTDFSSLSVCWNFLDRPVFRGLPFTLVRPDGSEMRFVVGDPVWRELDKLSGQGREGYQDFLNRLGLR